MIYILAVFCSRFPQIDKAPPSATSGSTFIFHRQIVFSTVLQQHPPSTTLTSPLCHNRHLSCPTRLDSPSSRAPFLSLPLANGSDSLSPTPAVTGACVPTRGLVGNVRFTSDCSSTSDADGDSLGHRSGMDAAVVRAWASPSSRRRPRASSVAAGTSRAVTGVLVDIGSNGGKR